MGSEIRHRRLYAYLRSEVLNALMIVAEIGLLMLPASGYEFILPLVMAGTAFALFIGYSVWFWCRKPEKVMLNSALSEMSSWFGLYYLIVVAIKAMSVWWYVFPVAGAVVLMFVFLLRPRGTEFVI